MPRWPTEPARGASSPARQGVTDSPRSLRIFADHLSETAQVTHAGRLTCAGAAGEPKLAPLRRASAGLSPFGHVLARPGLPMRSTRTSALRDLVQAICPRRTEEITIFPVSGSFAAKAEPIRSYLAPGRSFGRSGYPGGSSGSAILPALAGTCPGSDPNRLKGEPLVIEARSLPVGDRCLIAIGSPGSSPCRPSRRCVSVIRGEASDSLREGGQIEACQLLHDVSSDAGQGVRVGLFQAAQPGLG